MTQPATPATEAAPGSAVIGTTAEASAGARIPLRHVLLLGGLSALGALSTDMYLPALPALSQELGATMSQTQVTLSAGILGFALGQVIAGPSSDAMGRRRPLLIGLILYTLASLLCIIAPSIELLTLLRFVQGLAGAAGIAIALAIVSDLYTGTAQARLYALLMQVSSLGPIVAPIIGSQLLRFTSWHGIFIALALIGVALLAATALGLGESLPAERRQRGGIAIVLKVFQALLADRRFLGYALASGLAIAAGITYISVSPFILQNIYGVSAQTLGILLGVNALGIVAMAWVSGRLAGRVSPYHLLGWGAATIAAGGIALLLAAISGVGLIGIQPALFVIVSSLGLIVPSATTLALSNTQAAGSAAALLGVLQLLIGTIAAPLIGMGGTATILPMAIAIAGFGIATVVVFRVFCREE